MAYSYPVKHMHERMRGAPVISATVGAMIAALDAFLITGWGPTTALSVTVSGGVGTAQFNDGVYFEEEAVVLIDGVTSPALLNGEARVLSRTSKSITFATDAPDGVATGSITVRYAPVGWEKVYNGINKAVYRSKHVKSAGHFLRVDDTGIQNTKIAGYEVMTDVDTGTGMFPSTTIVPSGYYWVKSASSTSSSARSRYLLAADPRFLLTAFSVGTSANEIYTGTGIRGFGDPIVLATAGDPWATVISGTQGGGSYLSRGSFTTGDLGDSYAGCAMPRAFAGLGSAIFVGSRPFTGSLSTTSGADNFCGAAPSSVNGRILFSEVFLREAFSSAPPRAVIPGVRYIPHSGVASIAALGDFFPGSDAYAGRKFFAVAHSDSTGSSVGGVGAIDISGPWRPD
ncbi:hypothetical protein G7047_19220 [Diaphorobacter sp. HDW4A]|uniref:hypothetical protein n=1 Tax=Diaphorobacter sp. HDW4A TaxID=2714924 RepID=UPI00140C6B54|nr:hypothetical protein [Diaphorobacter sp. HDW4A]QIL81809.1 hypothetical protein G7047_19220 [Diaphorobacter sp. HDW4A]